MAETLNLVLGALRIQRSLANSARSPCDGGPNRFAFQQLPGPSRRSRRYAVSLPP
jgi:hypothetical protein